MTRSVYLLGEPGVGKSTVMRHLLEGWTAGPYERWTSREMFGHYLAHPEQGHGAYLGHLRPEYPGTDALSLSVAPQALIWLASLPLLGLDYVFGEGARLAHASFLAELGAQTELTVVYLTAPAEVAAERRLARGGKLLSERYCKVAAGKSRNLAASIPVLEVQSEGDPREVAAQIWRHVDHDARGPRGQG